MPRTWFVVSQDGSIFAPPEVWAWLSAKASQVVRRDRQSGHEVDRLLEFVQATAEAAQMQTRADDTVVSSPKPTDAATTRLEITTEEAAMRMHCSAQYVRRLCVQGRIPARRVGSQWLVDSAGIDRETPRSSQ